MISRNGQTIVFTAEDRDIEILDFVDSKNQLFELDRIIQDFINQRRAQRQFDLEIDLKELIGDPLALQAINEAIQEFKDRQSNG